MKPSPLQLHHYHFTSLAITVAQGFDLSKMASGESPYPQIDPEDLKVEIRAGEPESDGSELFVVSVAVAYEPPANSAFPYEFSASVEGVFTLDVTDDGQDREKIVVVNGAGMLMGAIREQLLTLSARHRFGPMLLPTLDLRQLAPEENTEETVATKPKRKAAKPAKKPKP